MHTYKSTTSNYLHSGNTMYVTKENVNKNKLFSGKLQGLVQTNNVLTL